MDHMDALSRIELLEDALQEALTLIDGLMGSDAKDSEVVLYIESVLYDVDQEEEDENSDDL
jgi:hypothetical protein